MRLSFYRQAGKPPKKPQTKLPKKPTPLPTEHRDCPEGQRWDPETKRCERKDPMKPVRAAMKVSQRIKQAQAETLWSLMSPEDKDNIIGIMNGIFRDLKTIDKVEADWKKAVKLLDGFKVTDPAYLKAKQAFLTFAKAVDAFADAHDKANRGLKGLKVAG